ncbi:hypothetical protein C1646_763849 [Rhizophagus diaphanus]|nr:hypothetical protein C1646_763849 [Rhizophagus diaphanus] [Rhizophagus sp. MUCL 43196]
MYFPLLHDQHWQTSEVFDFTHDIADQILKPVGKIDFNFKPNTQENRNNQEQTNQGLTPTDNNSCDVKIRKIEDYKNIIQCITNRRQEYQKIIINVLTKKRFTDLSSFSLGYKWKFEKESRVMIIQKLCENDHIVPFNIIKMENTNQNLYDKDSISKNDSTLRKLLPNHTLDVASLLELLKNKYSYHETIYSSLESAHQDESNGSKIASLRLIERFIAYNKDLHQ